ncbi:MAG: protein BatD, partial [Chitinophagia bacterium]|nr:protein BatD [Chitinophagia bacterium]
MFSKLITGLVFIGVLLGSANIWAQVSFSATPANAQMGINDQLQITFNLNNVENLLELSPTGFGEFDLLAGPFQSQSVSVINGRQTSSVSLTYVVHPHREGKLVIPPAIARDATGHTYQSNSITVDVVKGSLAQRNNRGGRQQQQLPEQDPNDPFTQMQQQMQQLRQLQQQMMQGMPSSPYPPQGQQQAQQANPALSKAEEEELKKNLFIKVEANKTKAYVGEQITIYYKLYSRVSMEVALSKLPSLNGFWTQDFDIPKVNPTPTKETFNGKEYQVYLLKKSAIFPQESGTLELDPAEGKGIARLVDPNARYSMFSAGYIEKEVHLKSQAVKINVLPLPDKGKPADFGGAVGKFTLKSKCDKLELTTDDVATFTITIQGSGNLKLIEAPKLTLPNGINTYDPVITDTITGRTTTIEGSKIIAYAIAPHTVGEFEIPAIPFTYFNPESGTYITQNTTPIKVKVKQGKNNPTNTTTTTDKSIAHLKDIHTIITTPATTPAMPILMSAGYWSIYATPLLSFVALLLYRRNKEAAEKDMVSFKSKRANKIASQRFNTANKHLAGGNKNAFYEELSKAVWLYLSDKLRVPLADLSKDKIHAILAAKAVTPSLLANFDSLIEECEIALYASADNTKMSSAYQQAIKVISELEN